MASDDDLREELRLLLEGGNAHLSFDEALRDFPVEARGKRPRGLPYSAWELLEHMRIAQNDIFEFIRDAKYVSPPWPEGYWPGERSPSDEKAWNNSLKAFRADRRAIIGLVMDPVCNLLQKIPHGTGQTIMREALLVADHTAYHLGQMVELRRLLGIWSK